MNSKLQSALDKAELLDGAFVQIFREFPLPGNRRGVVTWALCRAAAEHADAQRILISAGHIGTALALIRLQLEATVRAAWTFHVASATWLDGYASPITDGNLGEPKKVEGVKDMINALAVHMPEKNVAELQNFYATAKVMHSFVHGGVHAVVHSLRPYPPEKLLHVLENRNLLLWFTGQTLAVSSEDTHVAASVSDAFNRYHAAKKSC